MTEKTMIARILLAAVIGLFATVATAQTPAQQRQQQQRPPAVTAPRPAVNPDAMPEITAKQAIAIDYQTGFVMFERAADERMPPSSMSKIMTAYMVFEALKAGQISLDDMLPVSERAWRMQGSKMFVPLNGRAYGVARHCREKVWHVRAHKNVVVEEEDALVTLQKVLEQRQLEKVAISLFD
jgi:D-alanyl-D-alanine carboxypeptidase